MGARITLATSRIGVHLQLEGDVDLAVRGELALRLAQAAYLSTGTVTVHAGRVTFVDCSGIRPLEEARVRLEAIGGRLEIATASHCLRRVSALAGYTELAALCVERERAHEHPRPDACCGPYARAVRAARGARAHLSPSERLNRSAIVDDSILPDAEKAQAMGRRYARWGTPSTDLEQVALLAFLRAACAFDGSPNEELLAFAVLMIHSDIKGWLRCRGWREHPPRPIQH